MKITEKLGAKGVAMQKNPPVTIAFLGDSVTQGCFECFLLDDGGIDTVFDGENAYSRRLYRLLQNLYPKTQINIINAGISGDSAYGGVKRIDRDVLAFHPDLVIVSYGLNDTHGSDEGIPGYKSCLKTIFEKIASAGAECIFLTENAMNTKISPHLPREMRELAAELQHRQNSGLLDRYFDAAREVAAQCGVAVCDCYQKWKRMIEVGVDTTELLANKLNHPARMWHDLFAFDLLETILFE